MIIHQHILNIIHDQLLIQLHAHADLTLPKPKRDFMKNGFKLRYSI